MHTGVPTGGDQRLVHVQRDRERALDPRERIPASGDGEHRTRTRALDRLGDQRLAAGEVRHPVDVLRQLARSPRGTDVRGVAHLSLILS